ncbi:DUF3152 domain-containing protein [Mangrovihabitans endophyticus]|uniref:DUF3152 domain-containing protein n=1 Tax=Mangrovihabitans endophyticus TaxID=1751298 RepID=A0A8J3FPY4_9ACTN|nr:DUF3152 domain-containing protein [Mangrovihabitans endophyticus]GGK96346.1 hypothetical protein GCM10012284_33230 [Mangrovihabitans endophyticus]
MIDTGGMAAVTSAVVRHGRWHRWALPLAGAVLVLVAGAVFGQRPSATSASAAPSAAPGASPSAASSPAAPPSPAAPSSSSSEPPSPEPLLAESLPALVGPVPSHGAGNFRYAAAGTGIRGTAGRLRRYQVAVENGSGEDLDAFAGVVDAVLGDPRSWVGGGDLRLQRVGRDDDHDFTVFLATRDTAGRMCRNGGVNVTVGGRPYTSCRVTGKAIINLDRWRLSAKPYVAAGTPLARYREYVINHEVGHELGHHHEGCPKRGGPAPVMVQQTLTLRGCRPYAWPRLNGGELTGPAL